MNLWKKSLPRSVKVCGYTVKKLPFGRYLEAVERLRTLPAGLMEALFPGMSLSDALGFLKGMDETRLTQLVGSLLSIIPAQLVGLVAEMTGIPEQALLEDEAIGLDGILKIIRAFAEVNDLEGFFADARMLTRQLRGEQATPGFRS